MLHCTESLPNMVQETKEDKNSRRSLYPPIEPFFTGFMEVGDPSIGHKIYYEQSGKKDGLPVLVSHGGPGGGTQDYYRQYFDPSVYHIIAFDQRGCKRSTPHVCLEDNTTHHIIEDMEKIRTTLGIEKWVLFGGSWGSCISLAYSEKHPSRVLALVLRGIFTLRREELEWYYCGKGNNFLFPQAYEQYVSVIPNSERGDIMSAYYRRFTGNDEEEKLKCAVNWSKYEMATSKLHVDPAYIARGDDPHFALAFASIECHYFVNGGFFEYDGQLVVEAKVLEDNKIPGTMVQGRYDVVCPIKTAYDVHRNWPSSKLVVVPDSGHSCKEEGIISELIRATDHYRSLA